MNPISYARYLSTHSTSSLARELGMSRQYLSRVEQGVYDKPNTKILNWAATTISKAGDRHISDKAIEQLYREWQWQKRESTRLNKALRPLEVTEYDVAREKVRNNNSDIVYYHRIFTRWRCDYWPTTHAFCVEMCMHPSPVADYEEGRTHSMPNNLRDILLEMRLIGEGFKTNER